MRFDAPVAQTDNLNVMAAHGAGTEGFYNPNRDVSKIGLEWLRMVMHQIHHPDDFLDVEPYHGLLLRIPEEQRAEQLAKVQEVWATALADIRDNYRIKLEEHLATAGFHELLPDTQILAMALLGEITMCVIIRSVHDLTPKHGLPPQVRTIDALHNEALRLAAQIRKSWEERPWYQRLWKSIRRGVTGFFSRTRGDQSTT